MFIGLGAAALVAGTVLVTAVEGFPVVPTVGLSLGWLVALWFVWRLLTGKLMTRPAHEEQMAVMRETYQRQVDDVIHDRGEWRAQSRITDTTVVELLDQQRGLMTSIANAVGAVMDAIKDNSDETRGGAS